MRKKIKKILVNLKNLKKTKVYYYDFGWGIPPFFVFVLQHKQGVKKAPQRCRMRFCL